MANSTADHLEIPIHIGNSLAIKPITRFGKPESGLIRIAPSCSSRTDVGEWVGTLDKVSNGREYWKVWFEGRFYKVSRVVYFLHTNTDPKKFEVDHKDRNPLNNNVNNLRLLDSSGQKHNMSIRTDNKSGARGVTWSKKAKKWRSQIRINNRYVHLGYYSCLFEAAIAYNNAVALEYPDFVSSKGSDLTKLNCECSQCKRS